MALETIPRKGQAVSRAELAANRAAGLKRCFACQETKPFECFSADNGRSDGLQPRCKACYAAWRLERVGPRKPPLTVEERAVRRREARARWIAKNRETYLERQRDWMRRNKDEFEAYRRRWCAENAERVALKRKAWKEANAERITQTNKAYLAAHRGEYAAHARARQARKRQATPIWADLEKIKAFYIEAARLTDETGVPHHVDHIFPLKGETMCGLHVENNLQVLSGSENISKGNRLPSKIEGAW